MILDLFKNLEGLLEPEKVVIDNTIFRLHHTFTVVVLCIFTIIVSTKQFTGKPIECAYAQGVPSEIINSFCWVHTTYTIPDALTKKVGVDIPYPGIDNSKDESKFKYHKYYQWVPFTLLFQAAMFYSPRWLWLAWEGRKIKTLLMDLGVCILPEAEKREKKTLLVEYFINSWRTHDFYARMYLVCEILCLLNVIFQVFLTDLFLDGYFFTYGIDFVKYHTDKKQRYIDPFLQVFPHVTKCRFNRFSSSGSIEKYDAICVMGLNVINEKVFLFLWFWYVVLFTLTCCTLVFHLVVFTNAELRVILLCMSYGFDREKSMRTLVREASFGDWFLIYMLGQNMDFIIFRELVKEMRLRTEEGVKEREEEHED